LSQGCSDEESSIRTTGDREPGRIRVTLSDQPIGRSKKIIDGGLFVTPPTSVVPFLSELGSTADICDRK
jgi:hypothetical protein